MSHINIEGYEINLSQLKYECTFCMRIKGGRIIERNEKNKNKYQSWKPIFHKHGSSGELHNRKEYRGSHCPFNNKDVCIHITDNTLRN